MLYVFAVLHIHNGDCSADVGKESDIPGEHFAWRESLAHGPLRLGFPLDEHISERATFLCDDDRSNRDQIASGLASQEELLSKAARAYQEVVIWVEHDLLCQVTLAYLLHAFATRAGRPRYLSLVCAGEYPGIDDFRGLGQLEPEQFERLFEYRQPLNYELIDLGSSAWKAYAGDDPTALDDFIHSDNRLPKFPHMAPALRAHLSRFPRADDGLGRIERIVLESLEIGPKSFASLFEAFGKTAPLFGFGDLQLQSELDALANAETPFVRRKDGNYELTDAGQQALEGSADFIALNGIDRWLGGVHLVEGNIWRRDPFSGEISRQ